MKIVFLILYIFVTVNVLQDKIDQFICNCYAKQREL